MPDSENLRHRANQLLLLAQKARDDEHIKLAEYITDRAAQLFDEAIILERGKILLTANARCEIPRPAAQGSTSDGEFSP
jgi:hypothetical protein